MRLFDNKRELIINDDNEYERVTYEEKIQWLYKEFFIEGDECNIILSEEVLSGKNPLLGVATTAGFGLAGLAYSMPAIEHKNMGDV